MLLYLSTAHACASCKARSCLVGNHQSTVLHPTHAGSGHMSQAHVTARCLPLHPWAYHRWSCLPVSRCAMLCHAVPRYAVLCSCIFVHIRLISAKTPRATEIKHKEAALMSKDGSKNSDITVYMSMLCHKCVTNLNADVSHGHPDASSVPAGLLWSNSFPPFWGHLLARRMGTAAFCKGSPGQASRASCRTGSAAMSWR